jgi:acyl dehydratase
MARNEAPPVAARQLYVEDLAAGDAMPEREFGPHTLVAAVYWAGIQENPAGLHFDRDHARNVLGAKSIVASGALRQSLLVRAIMEWLGPRAFIRSMALRHTASTYEGDIQFYSASVARVEKEPQPLLTLTLSGRNQHNETIVAGQCNVLLPGRAWPADRPVWSEPQAS